SSAIMASFLLYSCGDIRLFLAEEIRPYTWLALYSLSSRFISFRMARIKLFVSSVSYIVKFLGYPISSASTRRIRANTERSEERRVGKEGSSRGALNLLY